MTASPDRSIEPSFLPEPSPPSLSNGSGRASARLLRPRRDPAPGGALRTAEPTQPAASRVAERGFEVPPRLSLTAGDRLVVQSVIAAPSAHGQARDGMLRTGATGAVILLAIFGALSLGHLLFGLLPPAVLHLAHLG